MLRKWRAWLMTDKNINAAQSIAQTKKIFSGLMDGNRYTPLDINQLFNCLSANQRLSELRLKYAVPLLSRFIKLPNGKRVKEHWLEQSYIDGINVGVIVPPNFYKG